MLCFYTTDTKKSILIVKATYTSVAVFICLLYIHLQIRFSIINNTIKHLFESAL